jgi:hypothetical protein
MADTARFGSDELMGAIHLAALWTLVPAPGAPVKNGWLKPSVNAAYQSTAQRQNLLRAAFAGQLVPQDPADEPAAELLARIRAGRAAAGGGTRAHRSRPAKEVS